MNTEIGIKLTELQREALQQIRQKWTLPCDDLNSNTLRDLIELGLVEVRSTRECDKIFITSNGVKVARGENITYETVRDIYFPRPEITYCPECGALIKDV